MGNADTSISARISRKKQKILSGSDKRSTARNDYSTLQAINLGNRKITNLLNSGRVEDIPCGCIESLPPCIGPFDLSLIEGEYNSAGIESFNIVWAKTPNATSETITIDPSYGMTISYNTNPTLNDVTVENIPEWPSPFTPPGFVTVSFLFTAEGLCGTIQQTVPNIQIGKWD